MGAIYQFTDFNSFHRMANGGLESRHDDVQVFRFSDLRRETNATPLFKTSFYQVGLFRKVRIEVGYFGRPQKLDHENVIVLFKPGQTVSFSKSDPNAEGYAIMFKEHFIDWRQQNANALKDFPILDPATDCVILADKASFDELTDLAASMFREYGKPLDPVSMSILKWYAQIMLQKISRLMPGVRKATDFSVQFETAQRFRGLVYQHIHATKSVRDYADMLFMSEKSLINHVKQTNGSTPKDFINAVILEESKAMLRNETRVEEVAAYFNFTDPSHFSNFFRKKTGQSPSDFRKRK